MNVSSVQPREVPSVRFVDLSVPLADDKDWAPWWARVKVKRQSHVFGRRVIRFVLRLPSKYLQTGLGWANDEIKLSTHSTTHLDAPWHYAPTSEGSPARTIDQVPLDWCYGDGVVLDMRYKQDGEAVQVDEVVALRRRRQGVLPPGEADESRQAPADGIQGLLLPAEGRGRLGRPCARRRDDRGLTFAAR
jgi:Putative cyclase